MSDDISELYRLIEIVVNAQSGLTDIEAMHKRDMIVAQLVLDGYNLPKLRDDIVNWLEKKRSK